MWMFALISIVNLIVQRYFNVLHFYNYVRHLLKTPPIIQNIFMFILTTLKHVLLMNQN